MLILYMLLLFEYLCCISTKIGTGYAIYPCHCANLLRLLKYCAFCLLFYLYTCVWPLFTHLPYYWVYYWFLDKFEVVAWPPTPERATENWFSLHQWVLPDDYTSAYAGMPLYDNFIAFVLFYSQIIGLCLYASFCVCWLPLAQCLFYADSLEWHGLCIDSEHFPYI